MDNDIDPPSFLEEDNDDFKIKHSNVESNVITGIPIFEHQNQNKKIEISNSKSKISISAVDKKKQANNTPNFSSKVLLKDTESKNEIINCNYS